MLTNAERGLYITACALIYSAGGPIERQHLRSACSDHGNAFNRQLQRLVRLGKLIENGSEIDNKRCENELENARKRGEKARENGAKGGRPNGLENPGVPAVEKLTINHQPSTIIEETPDGVSLGKQERAHVGSNGRGTRLSEAWRPSAEDVAFASGLGLDPGAVADEFADYWRAVAGGKGVKLDWDATWRNWCRRAQPRASNGDARSRGGGQGDSRIAAALSRVHLQRDRERMD
jgi:uncharacterized protein YdaU (DUF1376 family)